MIPNLGFDESQGFRICHRGGLNRCDRHQLIVDYPILRRIYPLVRDMRMLDRAAFAADLLLLGYTTKQIREASQCGNAKIIQLRTGMEKMGLLPKCGCGRQQGHRGTCGARLIPERRSEIRQAYFSTRKSGIEERVPLPL